MKGGKEEEEIEQDKQNDTKNNAKHENPIFHKNEKIEPA